MSSGKEKGKALLEEDTRLGISGIVGVHVEAVAIGEADVASEDRVEYEGNVDADVADEGCDVAALDDGEDSRVVAVDCGRWGGRARKNRGGKAGLG